MDNFILGASFAPKKQGAWPCTISSSVLPLLQKNKGTLGWIIVRVIPAQQSLSGSACQLSLSGLALLQSRSGSNSLLRVNFCCTPKFNPVRVDCSYFQRRTKSTLIRVASGLTSLASEGEGGLIYSQERLAPTMLSHSSKIA